MAKDIKTTESEVRKECEGIKEALTHIVEFDYPEITEEINESIKNSMRQLELMERLEADYLGRNLIIWMVPAKQLETFISDNEKAYNFSYEVNSLVKVIKMRHKHSKHIIHALFVRGY